MPRMLEAKLHLVDGQEMQRTLLFGRLVAAAEEASQFAFCSDVARGAGHEVLVELVGRRHGGIVARVRDRRLEDPIWSQALIAPFGSFLAVSIILLTRHLTGNRYWGVLLVSLFTSNRHEGTLLPSFFAGQFLGLLRC